MTQVISKTGQKNNQFGTWTDAIGYKAGDTVVYEGSIYSANSDIPPDTSFVPGTVGPTWAKIVEGGGTASEIGAGTPGNVTVSDTGVVTISAEDVANVVTVDANGLTLLGNLTLTGPEALNITGSPGAGSVLSTDANGTFEWTSLANAVGNSIAVDGLNTTGNITTTGSITSNTLTISETIEVAGDITAGSNVTVEGNITSNATISGNAVQGNTGDFGTLTVTTGANLGNVANLTILGGNAGEFLQTDGNGTLTWAPAGSQSNGNSGITTNASNVTMTIDGNTVQVIDSSGTTVTGNITATETITGNTVVANTIQTVDFTSTGNANLGDVSNVHIAGGSPGQVLGTDGTGNLVWVPAGSTANGNSGITTNTSNVILDIAGNTIQVIDANGTTTTGNANISGDTNVEGNITGGNITSNGTVTTETLVSNTTIIANGNITSNATISGNVIEGNTATISGNLNAGNITSSGTVTSDTVVANTFTGGNISGDGAGLTNITGSNVVGDVPSALVANFANFAGNVTGPAQPNITSLGTLTGLSIGGDIIPDADEVYDLGNATHKFRDLWLSGSTLRLGNASLSSNGGNVVMSTIVANTVNANLFTGDGSGLSNIPGANVVGPVGQATQAQFAQNVTFPLQPNITSVGELTALGVAGNVDIGGDLNVVGNLNYANVGQLVVANPFIYIADGNPGDLLDMGLVGETDGGIYNGIARDRTTDTWRVFSNLAAQPTTTIDWSNTVAGNFAAGNTVVSTLSVGGVSQLGTVANVKILGGAAGQTLSTDGTGNLSWSSSGTAENANIANFANFAGNITIAAQPNITSLGTLSSLAITGNLSTGNISSTGSVIATGIIQGVSLTSLGTINSAGNITGPNITGTLYGAGNNISNIQGANVTGNVTSAVTANFANFAGNVTVAAQPNITSLGTLTGLTVSGNINATGANVSLGAVGNVKVTGGSSGQFLQTNGSGNLSWATPATTAIANGTSKISIPVADSGIIFDVGFAVERMVINQSNIVIGGDFLPSSDAAPGNLGSSTFRWGNLFSSNITNNANLTTSNLTATGTANLGAVGNVKITGGTSGQYLQSTGNGNIVWATVPSPTSIANGTSNVSIPTANSDILFTRAGSFAGRISSDKVSLGVNSSNSGSSSVSIGTNAGNISQGSSTVAIGDDAGFNGQASGAVAIGAGAARNIQGSSAVAIGLLAGQQSQGASSIAIGARAANVSQANNSIILNATGLDLNSTTANTLYVAPIRNATESNIVFYNPTTKEVTYGIATVPTGANFANFAGNVTEAAQPNITSVGTLTSLAVSGNINATGANVSLGAVGNVKVTGGTTGQYLQTDGSGNLSWSTVAAGQATSIANGSSSVGFSDPDGFIMGNVAGTKSLEVRFDGVGLGWFSAAIQDGVAIGSRAVANVNSVSVGVNAGTFQNIGPNSVVVGGHAGYRTSGSNVVVVGSNSGMFTTTTGAVIVGSHSAQNAAGANSIAIGFKAVADSSGNNSIVLNATGTAITASANRLYIDPVRNATTSNVMYYDTATKEVTYAAPSVAASIVNGASSVVVGSNGTVTINATGWPIITAQNTGVVVSGSHEVTLQSTLGPVNEKYTTITGATGVVNHVCSSYQIFNHDSIASNFTVNLTALSVAPGSATVVTLMLNQGSTAYIPNALQIAGTAQTIKWQGGTVPTGNANKLDAVAFTILRAVFGTSYTVTGQLVSYG